MNNTEGKNEQEIERFTYLLSLVLSWISSNDETHAEKIILTQMKTLGRVLEEVLSFHDLPEDEQGMFLRYLLSIVFCSYPNLVCRS